MKLHKIPTSAKQANLVTYKYNKAHPGVDPGPFATHFIVYTIVAT